MLENVIGVAVMCAGFVAMTFAMFGLGAAIVFTLNHIFDNMENRP